MLLIALYLTAHGIATSVALEEFPERHIDYGINQNVSIRSLESKIKK